MTENVYVECTNLLETWAIFGMSTVTNDVLRFIFTLLGISLRICQFTHNCAMISKYKKGKSSERHIFGVFSETCASDAQIESRTGYSMKF